MARQQLQRVGTSRLPHRRSQAKPTTTPRFRPRTVSRKTTSTPRSRPRTVKKTTTSSSSSGASGAAARFGGAALVAVAGIAFRNRDKLARLVKRGKDTEADATPAPVPAVPPVADVPPTPPVGTAGLNQPPAGTPGLDTPATPGGAPALADELRPQGDPLPRREPPV